MAFHKTLCMDCVGNHDAYKDITYTMGWIYIHALHAGHAMLAIIADTFLGENMLLTHVAGNTLVYLELFVSWIPMQILDGGSQNPLTIIIIIESISQLKMYVLSCTWIHAVYLYECDIWICVHWVHMYAMIVYVCVVCISMKCMQMYL